MQFALAGADIIVICGRSSSSLEDTKSEIQAAAPHCMVLPIPTDITDEASVQSLFDGVPRTPDILINNAGTSSSQESIVDSEPDDWWSDWVSSYYVLTAKGVAHETTGNKSQRHISLYSCIFACFSWGTRCDTQRVIKRLEFFITDHELVWSYENGSQ